jgi:hypothetical protein
MKSFRKFEFIKEKLFIFRNRNFGMWQTTPLKRNLIPRFVEAKAQEFVLGRFDEVEKKWLKGWQRPHYMHQRFCIIKDDCWSWNDKLKEPRTIKRNKQENASCHEHRGDAVIPKASSRSFLDVDEGLQLLLLVMTLFFIIFWSFLKGGLELTSNIG